MSDFDFIPENVDSLGLNHHVCGRFQECIDCLTATNQTDNNDGVCQAIWFHNLCWRATPVNTTVYQSCYVLARAWNNSEPVLALHCNSTTGKWNDWFDTSLCYSNSQSPANSTDSSIAGTESWNNSNLDSLYDETKSPRETILRVVCTVSHSLSLISLLSAILVFILLKNLRCTRIYIHMNLMFAFILRNVSWFLHLVVFEGPNAIEDEIDTASIFLFNKMVVRMDSSSLVELNMLKEQLCTPYVEGHNQYVWCRLYYVLNNYAVIASYFWLLVEGLYLALILKDMTSNNSKKTIMRIFLALGWGLPWLSVIGSVIAKLIDPNESKGCWFEENNSFYWFIVKVPILISVLINFIIFILVVRVVGSKLKVNKRHRTEDDNDDYKWRLCKATLALIPLLGIQYVITVFFSFINIQNQDVVFAQQAFELSFVSVQGFLIAFIYCFLTKEVREELKKFWKRLNTEWMIESERKKKSNTARTNLFNLKSFSCSKKQSGRVVRPTDTAYTFAPSSLDSPQRRRYCGATYTETTRVSPFTAKRSMTSLINAAGSPILGSLDMQETCLSTADGSPYHGSDRRCNSVLTSRGSNYSISPARLSGVDRVRSSNNCETEIVSLVEFTNDHKNKH